MKIMNCEGKLLWESDHDNIQATLEAACKAKADLYRASLDGASLVGASLDGASLVGARLVGASLVGASLVGARLDRARLDGASLDRASLVGASLVGARLVGARLDRASLDGASLVGASLDGASLDRASLVGASLVGARLDAKTRVQTGETWKEYVEQVVPALLAAAGKALDAVLATDCWNCHSWTNCPMAEAFGVHDLVNVPILHRPRAAQFIQFFDARLIPKSLKLEDPPAVAAACPAPAPVPSP